MSHDTDTLPHLRHLRALARKGLSSVDTRAGAVQRATKWLGWFMAQPSSLRHLVLLIALATACGGGSSTSPSAFTSTLDVDDGLSLADGYSVEPVTVTVRDGNGAPVPGVAVVFQASGEGNTLTPSSAVTDASGIATSDLTSTVAEVKTVSATVGGARLLFQHPTVDCKPLVAMADLVISEVGSWNKVDYPAWVEIYNGTAAEVDLSAYVLRAPAVDAATGNTLIWGNFPLPFLRIPAGAYAVVAGKVPGSPNYDGRMLVHVADANGNVPYWKGSGFVELVKSGATVDFVRFGSSDIVPTTTGWWNGLNAPSFPVAMPVYNVALARRPNQAVTRTAADWRQVEFSTPGGPNDVEPGAVDADGDGIPDSAETRGGTFAGMDLWAMGARTGQKDVFLELDAMASTDPGIIPRKEALDIVVAKFKGRQIHLHFDAGDRFPGSYDLGQRDATVPFSRCITFPREEGCEGDLLAYKARYMEVRRRGIFHYVLFGSTQNPSGADGSSGLADLVGPSLLVSLGGWGFRTEPAAMLNKLVNSQAATLMHEFGHNLGLEHGGNEPLNYKPNYFSIMNYLYQLQGLSNPATATAGDRFAYWNFDKPTDDCLLEAGPCDDPRVFRMDFSDGTGASINEASVSETGGLGRRGRWVDFNDNGRLDDGNSLVLAPMRARPVRNVYFVLKDYNDWANLKFPFQGEKNWVEGFIRSEPTAAMRSPLAPFADHTLRRIKEEAPPPSYFEALRQGNGAR